MRNPNNICHESGCYGNCCKDRYIKVTEHERKSTFTDKENTEYGVHIRGRCDHYDQKIGCTAPLVPQKCLEFPVGSDACNYERSNTGLPPIDQDGQPDQTRIIATQIALYSRFGI